MGLRIGVDVGGTFTDFLVVDEAGNVGIHKTSTTPGDPSRQLRQVLCRIPDAGDARAGAPAQYQFYGVRDKTAQVSFRIATARPTTPRLIPNIHFISLVSILARLVCMFAISSFVATCSLWATSLTASVASFLSTPAAVKQ